MSSYAKLFSSIVTSTIWSAPDHVRIVWITMMALADRDGVVEASIPGLATVARFTIKQTEDALKVLQAPDPYSRSKTNQGRRIATVDGGWRLVNYEKYREKATKEEAQVKATERQRRFKLRHQIKGKSNAQVTPVTQNNASNDKAEAPSTVHRPPSSGSSGVCGEPARTHTPCPPDVESLWETFQAMHGRGSPSQFSTEVGACMAAGRTKEEIGEFIRAHPGLDVFGLGHGLIPAVTRPSESKPNPLANIAKVVEQLRSEGK